jgi:hypothetical protein
LKSNNFSAPQLFTVVLATMAADPALGAQVQHIGHLEDDPLDQSEPRLDETFVVSRGDPELAAEADALDLAFGTTTLDTLITQLKEHEPALHDVDQPWGDQLAAENQPSDSEDQVQLEDQWQPALHLAAGDPGLQPVADIPVVAAVDEEESAPKRERQELVDKFCVCKDGPCLPNETADQYKAACDNLPQAHRRALAQSFMASHYKTASAPGKRATVQLFLFGEQAAALLLCYLF